MSAAPAPLPPNPSRRRLAIAAPAAIGAALFCGAASGCQSTGPFARWRTANDDSIAPVLTADERAQSRTGSMISRWLGPTGARPEAPDPTALDGEAPGSTLILGAKGWKPKPSADDAELARDLDAAESLYMQGNLADAERAFAKIDRAHRPGLVGDGQRRTSEVGMKALYYLAETRYQRRNLVGAHEAFELLVTTYPGTPYLEKAVGREYEIARTWLAQSGGDPAAKLPWTARFTGGLPVFDTGGNALAVLDHVRHHDPTGPLADDAAMKIADYHYDAESFEQSAVYYDQLAADHPKSPLLRRAHLASIDSKMKAYIGPEYDGSGLEQARETVKRTMATFPERLASTDGGDEQQKLDKTLDLIADQDAERAYTTGLYYVRAGYPTSAEYYFGMISRRWPKSPWAELAKTQLATVAKQPRKLSEPSKIFTQPGATDPYNNGISSGNAGNLGGGGIGP